MMACSPSMGVALTTGVASPQLLAMAATGILIRFLKKPLRVVMLIPIGVGC